MLLVFLQPPTRQLWVLGVEVLPNNLPVDTEDQQRRFTNVSFRKRVQKLTSDSVQKPQRDLDL